MDVLVVAAQTMVIALENRAFWRACQAELLRDDTEFRLRLNAECQCHAVGELANDHGHKLYPPSPTKTLEM